MSAPTIYTIGHSTHALTTFLDMLRSFDIRLLADIRNFPSSKRYPHFNAEQLSESLEEAGISYIHLKALGGRREPRSDSQNDGWRVKAFRGYADYMETPAFREAFNSLGQMALERTTAYMCSEAVWWSCHRSLVSDLFKVQGWKVLHIMKAGKADEHPYTKPARLVGGELTYRKPGLFEGPD